MAMRAWALRVRGVAAPHRRWFGELMNRRQAASVRWGLATLGLFACGSESTPPPPPPPPPPPASPCSPSTTVSLAPLQGTTLDCSAGTTFTLAGNGATYLLVPQFATG